MLNLQSGRKMIKRFFFLFQKWKIRELRKKIGKLGFQE